MKLKIYDDNIGYVELVDKLPTRLDMDMDDYVVMAARTSHDTVSYADKERLIRYLMTNKHMSPFEQPQMTFRWRAPDFVNVHILRHRSGHFNGESARYHETRDEFYIPNTLYLQDKKNKQASGQVAYGIEYSLLVQRMKDNANRAHELYTKLIDSGVSKEIAREVLPVSTYKTYLATFDLRNFLNMAEQRISSHAQWETGILVYGMLHLIADFMPITFRAWVETISDPEVTKTMVKMEEYLESRNQENF